MIEHIKQRGLMNFIKESATTVFALGVLGASAWIINNQNSSNVQLAVISLQLEVVKENISALKESVISGDAQLRADVTELKIKVRENELKLIELKLVK